jgi:hypothetical protein
MAWSEFISGLLHDRKAPATKAAPGICDASAMNFAQTVDTCTECSTTDSLAQSAIKIFTQRRKGRRVLSFFSAAFAPLREIKFNPL